MKLVEVSWNPSQRQLRQFAVLCGIALPLVGWLWDAGSLVLTYLALGGLVVAAAGFFFPKLVKPVFVGMNILTAPIGMVIGEVAMLLIYFGVFVPIGLFFYIIKRDNLQLKIDRQAKTYWRPKKPPRDIGSYFRRY